jgi:hypothetical protein
VEYLPSAWIVLLRVARGSPAPVLPDRVADK